MDAFNTAVTAISFIYKFVDAQRNFSAGTRSLAIRFEWDLSALRQILDYFQEKQNSDLL
jgi:hypothetical protein